MHWIGGSRWRRAAVKIIFNLVLWQISNQSPYRQIFNLTEELWLIRWRKTFSIWPSLVTFGTDWVDLGQFGKVGEDRVGGAQGSAAAPKAVHCIALTPHLPPKPLHHPPPHFCYHLGPTGRLQCQISERSQFWVDAIVTKRWFTKCFQRVSAEESYLERCWSFSVVMFNKALIIDRSHWFWLTAL